MDVTAEPLEMLGPIKGVMESDELSLFDAALRTGLDIDSEAFASTEVGGRYRKCLSMQAGSYREGIGQWACCEGSCRMRSAAYC